MQFMYYTKVKEKTFEIKKWQNDRKRLKFPETPEPPPATAEIVARRRLRFSLYLDFRKKKKNNFSIPPCDSLREK